MSDGDALKRLVLDAAERALDDVAREIHAAAVRDAPPTDPEDDPNPAVTLKEAGSVTSTPGHREIAFDTPYAHKQHENFRLDHPRGGVPKFLERNVTAAAGDLERRVGAEIAKDLRARDGRGL